MYIIFLNKYSLNQINNLLLRLDYVNIHPPPCEYTPPPPKKKKKEKKKRKEKIQTHTPIGAQVTEYGNKMQQVKRNFPAPIPTHDLGGGSFPLIFARTFLVMPLTCYLQFSMNAFFKSKDIFFWFLLFF